MGLFPWGTPPFLKKTKKCIVCKRRKPTEAFGFHNKKTGSMRNQCRSCRSMQQLEKRYNITPTQHSALLKKQNGRCAICNTTSPSTLCVDHCHTTGEVRGLLCPTCNKGLGLFKDDDAILSNAITYLNYKTN